MDYEGTTATLEKASDIETNPQGVVRRWLLEINLADKREKDWRKTADNVWKIYRQKRAKKNSFNILWANTETLRPAVYNSLPSPDVRRRFKDADPLGKAVAETLSRSLEYGLDTTDFDHAIQSTVLDMLLPGRGVARVRYVPAFNQVPAEGATEGYEDELEWEQAPIDHVQWDDFRMGTGKEWCEVPWVAYRHRLTRDELEEKFGELGSLVLLDNTDNDDINKEQDLSESFKTAEVWEIWDKEERKVIFVSSGYKEAPLNTLADPLGLQSFFPSPRPLYSIEDSSNTVPTPLYELYREQADELDSVSKRINILIKGLKLRGIYDSTLSELSELMRGEDNDLIPAANVTALLERGGLEKAIWFMPIEQAANVLKELYIQREAAKAVIYEITGIADIIRGASDPNETARAQEIKSQWGSNRLKRMQGEVSRFIRDILRMQGEIIGEKFQQETLATMTGLKFPTMEEKQALIQQQAMQTQQPQQGQQEPQQEPQEIPPSWEEIMQVLRDDKQRTFKIDIETDSTIAASIESDMKGLTEVLGGITQLVQGLGPAVQMGAMPVEALKEIILTITRRAKMGNAVEDAMEKIQQPPPQQQPQDNSLEVAKLKEESAQMQTQMQEQSRVMQEQSKANLEQVRIQSEQQLAALKEQGENQREAMRLAHEADIERMHDATERWKVEYVEGNKFAIADMNNKNAIKQASISANQNADEEGGNEYTETGEVQVKPGLTQLAEAMTKSLTGLVEAQTANHSQLIDAISRPKTVLRGPDGKVVGVN